MKLWIVLRAISTSGDESIAFVHDGETIEEAFYADNKEERSVQVCSDHIGKSVQRSKSGG